MLRFQVHHSLACEKIRRTFYRAQEHFWALRPAGIRTPQIHGLCLGKFSVPVAVYLVDLPKTGLNEPAALREPLQIE